MPDRLRRATAAAALALCIAIAAAPAVAQSPDVAATAGPVAPDRMLSLGGAAAAGLPGTAALDLPALPAPGDEPRAVLAALLRATPVLRLDPDATALHPPTGALHLAAALALVAGPDGATLLAIGDETVEPADLAHRLGALVQAVAPADRGLGFLSLRDPEGRLAAALDPLRDAVRATGMGLTVLTVTGDEPACAPPEPALPLALLAGVADRPPLGDGNGLSDQAEIVRWLDGALARAAARADGCGLFHTLVLAAADDPGRVLVRHVDRPPHGPTEAAFQAEVFEALFLSGSDDAGAIGGFLDRCLYCPDAGALRDRLAAIEAEARAVALETALWERIADDTVPGRIEVYLAHCTLCVHRAAAEARLDALRAAATARVAETAAFDRLAAAPDLSGLRDWLATCIACDQRARAEALIAALVADNRNRAEQAALDAALTRMNGAELALWLETCTICDRRDEAAALRDRLSGQVQAAAACVAAAGLPQQGGPRLMAAIDRPAARAACTAALQDWPDNPTARLVAGRIALAEGDPDAAAAAFAAGMEAGLPAAWGLAAHLALDPPGSAAPDPARAERLAQEGYAQGDALSAEVLMTLWGQDRGTAGGPADAAALAVAMAEDGNPVAQFFAGYFHREGLGTDRAPALAARWFDAGAAQGYAPAQVALAELLETGATGVPADPARAAALFWDALNAGDPTARVRLTDQIDARSYDVVLALQTRLRDAGAFAGRIDGIPGPNTVAAVQRHLAPPDPAAGG